MLLLLFQSTGGKQPHSQKKHASKEDRCTTDLKVPIIQIDAQVISRTTHRVISGFSHDDFVISESNIRQEVYAGQYLPRPLSEMIVFESRYFLHSQLAGACYFVHRHARLTIGLALRAGIILPTGVQTGIQTQEG